MSVRVQERDEKSDFMHGIEKFVKMSYNQGTVCI